jgi:hypothetical protein
MFFPPSFQALMKSIQIFFQRERKLFLSAGLTLVVALKIFFVKGAILKIGIASLLGSTLFGIHPAYTVANSCVEDAEIYADCRKDDFSEKYCTIKAAQDIQRVKNCRDRLELTGDDNLVFSTQSLQENYYEPTLLRVSFPKEQIDDYIVFDDYHYWLSNDTKYQDAMLKKAAAYKQNAGFLGTLNKKPTIAIDTA